MPEVSNGQLHHTDIPNMSMQTISTKHLTKHMLNIRLEPDTGCPDHVLYTLWSLPSSLWYSCFAILMSAWVHGFSFKLLIQHLGFHTIDLVVAGISSCKLENNSEIIFLQKHRLPIRVRVFVTNLFFFKYKTARLNTMAKQVFGKLCNVFLQTLKTITSQTLW